MATDDCGDCMICPHVRFIGAGEFSKLCSVALIWTAIGQRAVGTATRRVHCNRHITPACPMLGPGAKSFSTAAMNQHHPGEWTLARRRPPDISEYARRFSMIELALVIDLLHEA